VSEADLQALCDGLAAELGAAVSLVDLEERLLAHTAHDDVAVDEVRLWGIIHRRLTPEMRAWFDQWGYRESPGPMRTPADKKLGILERWCVPVRFRGAALGFVWLIFGRRKVNEADLAPAVEAANQIGALLYRRRLLHQVDTDLLRLLLIPNPENERVATEARALGTFAHTGPIAVVVAGSPDGEDLSSTALSDLTLAVQRAGEQASPDAALGGMILGLGILLAPLRKKDDLTPAVRVAERVRHLAAHISELDVLVAIGGATELENASHSYAEARRALRMARAMPDLRPIVTWDDLGVFRALSLVPPEEAENGAIDPRVRQLLADESLATTAETFLNLAGDVQRTAAELYVHRTTLYQRLDRIAALYKLDLRRNGDHRLIAHLGLKIARMAPL
jgi:PucR C-terminal helix-turn-helix domain/GGDEF-like domain